MTAVSDLMKYLETNWEMLVRDIEQGTIDSDIKISKELRKVLESKLKPDPKRAAELKREFSKGFGDPIIPRIWPEFAFCFQSEVAVFLFIQIKCAITLGIFPFFSVYTLPQNQ